MLVPKCNEWKVYSLIALAWLETSLLQIAAIIQQELISVEMKETVALLSFEGAI